MLINKLEINKQKGIFKKRQLLSPTNKKMMYN